METQMGRAKQNGIGREGQRKPDDLFQHDSHRFEAVNRHELSISRA